MMIILCTQWHWTVYLCKEGLLLLSSEPVQQLLWVRMTLLLLRRSPKLLLLLLGRPLTNWCWSAGRLLRSCSLLRWSRDLLRSLWQP